MVTLPGANNRLNYATTSFIGIVNVFMPKCRGCWRGSWGCGGWDEEVGIGMLIHTG